MKIDGSCHCGAIAFEAEIDPERVRVCHCSDCQKLSGTAFRVVAPCDEPAFRLTRGAPRIYVKIAESGSRRQQAFCGDCGSPVEELVDKYVEVPLKLEAAENDGHRARLLDQ